jgi:hypothetical protein
MLFGSCGAFYLIFSSGNVVCHPPVIMPPIIPLKTYNKLYNLLTPLLLNAPHVGLFFNFYNTLIILLPPSTLVQCLMQSLLCVALTFEGFEGISIPSIFRYYQTTVATAYYPLTRFPE